MFFKKKETTDSLKRAGFLDAKPIEYLNDQLVYVKYRTIYETPDLILKVRVYHDYLFKVVIIYNFSHFNLAKTTNKYLHDNNLLTAEEANLNHSMNIYLIEENTLRTREFARANTFLTKKGYQQVLIYNREEVVFDYYNVLPEFDFNLMKYYRTMAFFDLACHDKEDY